MNIILYEKYHQNIKLHKRVITPLDFTYRNTLEIINKYIPKKGNVLDIGSATGTISFYLGSKGLNVDGIELSQNAVFYANKNKEAFGIKNIHFYRTSIETYESTKKYDLILCFEVLEHIQDDISALKKIVKLMHNNSYLVLTVPSLNAPLYRLGLLNRFDKKVGHLRRYNLNNVKDLINSSGLQTVEEFKTEGILRSILYTNSIVGLIIKFTRFNIINNLITYIDNMTIPIFRESQLIFICRKKQYENIIHI